MKTKKTVVRSSKKKTVDAKMFFYERFADQFDSVVNKYDTEKRLTVIFDEMLSGYSFKGKKVLDAGCGTGWFGQEAAHRGAKVTSMDVGKKLLAQVAKKFESKRVVGSIMEMPFAANSFDVVVSSEVIEHVPDAAAAIRECARVLKPGGVVVLTTPNSFWHWSLSVAQFFKIRPYQGLENWLSFDQLKGMFQGAGLTVEDQYGIHLFPFVVPVLNPILDAAHALRRPLGRVMVNMAIKCTKPKA